MAIAKHETSKKITGQVLKRIMFRLCELQKKEEGRSRPSSRTSFNNYFLAGSSGFTSLPGIKGLHGLAFTGPDVFQTTLN